MIESKGYQRGEKMPIVEGRYEAKISTTFGSVEEAIDEIKNKIRRSRKIRISNIPMELLEELKPELQNKDASIVLPLNEKPTPEIRKLGRIATTKARIYKEYKGTEANSGSINFADRIFNIVWVDEKILEIDTMDYGRCVKCLNKTFETGWRYSEKYK
ncbi:MAG: hypothetical protein ACE5K0_02275 [Candidatus Methanofastidiosia archaeon]